MKKWYEGNNDKTKIFLDYISVINLGLDIIGHTLLLIGLIYIFKS